MTQWMTTTTKTTTWRNAAAAATFWVISGLRDERPQVWQMFFLNVIITAAEATAVLFSASSSSLFFCRQTTYESPHLAWWNFAWTCTLTTSSSLLNIMVIGQRSRSHGVFVCFCMHDTARTSWPRFTKRYTGMACGQYLAFSKAWRSCCFYRCHYAHFYRHKNCVLLLVWTCSQAAINVLTLSLKPWKNSCPSSCSVAKT